MGETLSILILFGIIIAVINSFAPIIIIKELKKINRNLELNNEIKIENKTKPNKHYIEDLNLDNNEKSTIRKILNLFIEEEKE